MATRIFNYRFDASQALATATDLEKAELFGPELVQRLNVARDEVYVLAKKRMLRGINLTQGYVERKMETVDATLAKPVAEIVAPVGARSAITNLSHYGIQQLKRPARSPKRRLRGFPALGIPVGERAAGVSAEVVVGARKRLGPLFQIPKFRDGEGNPLVFRRIGDTRKIEAVKGPSVYQLFRLAASEISDEAGEVLEREIMQVATYALTKALR